MRDERNQLFVRFDSGINDKNRYIILDNDKKLQLYCDKNMFEADSTFKKALIVFFSSFLFTFSFFMSY